MRHFVVSCARCLVRVCVRVLIDCLPLLCLCACSLYGGDAHHCSWAPSIYAMLYNKYIHLHPFSHESKAGRARVCSAACCSDAALLSVGYHLNTPSRPPPSDCVVTIRTGRKERIESLRFLWCCTPQRIGLPASEQGRSQNMAGHLIKRIKNNKDQGDPT